MKRVYCSQVGEAEVRAVFGSGSTKIAGCFVKEGKLKKGALIEVTRGAKTVFEGEITSLRYVHSVHLSMLSQPSYRASNTGSAN